MTTKNDITEIQNEDARFQKTAIREALGESVTEYPAQDLGPLYDNMSNPSVTLTTYFHAWSWYHITSISTNDQQAEDAFWQRLQQIVAHNPRLMSG